MPRDYPDWGVTPGAVAVYSLQDMAELAARLGSIDTFDRRGDVIFADGFENGLAQWYTSVIGTSGAVSASALRARSGGFSAKLITGTEVYGLAEIDRYFPYPALSRMGNEISFVVAGSVEQYEFGLAVNDGTHQLLALIRYDSQNKTLEYYGSDEAYHVFASDVNLFAYSYLFHTCKVVGDFANSKYVRLILDSTEYDLSAYALCSRADTTDPMASVYYIIYNKTAGSKTSYADDAIVTQNEP